MALDPDWQSFKSEVLEDLSRHRFGEDPKIIWNVGYSDWSGLLGSLQYVSEKLLKQKIQFDHTIRISIPSVMDTSGSRYETERNAVLAVANALGLMDEPDSYFRKRKNELDEKRYYSYGEERGESGLIGAMKNSIWEKIFGKRCLVIVENLLQPLNDPINEWLVEGWLPSLPDRWRKLNNWWLISTPSREVCKRSRGRNDLVLDLDREIRWVSFLNYGVAIVILDEELQRVAHNSVPISSSSRLAFCREQTTKNDILGSCLLYTQLLSPPVENYYNSIEGKELIRFWICEGLFTRTIQLKLKPSTEDTGYITVQLEEKKEEENTMASTDQDHELFEFTEIILEALLSSSLLRSSSQPHPPPTSISFPSPNTSHCIFPFSGMWKLLSRLDRMRETSSKNGLGLLTENDISNPTQLAKKNWISLATDSCKYITFRNPNKNKTTTLTLRGREDISQPTIDTLLSHMSFLRVLDLSYTSIESLPPSLAHLANLRLLSLKYCRKLISLTLDSSTSSPVNSLERLEVLDLHGVPLTEIPDDFGSKKFNIFYLDLSCPTITSLPFNFFIHMESRLRELVFLGCKSLTSLPSSLISLKNLETLSVSETKLAYLPPDTFKQMLRLRVLKLINNNLLEKLPKSLCNAQNLEEVELNGCRSLLAVDALPTNKLKVLKLIGNNHMVELPESLLQLQNLQELTVSDCKFLKKIKLIGLMSLKSFSLAQSPTVSLSLRGCQELETVVLRDLHKLEELDLSGTAIRELTPDISGLQKLKKLVVQATPQLRRIPWHLLDHISEILNIDQCERIITTNGCFDDHGNINPHVGVRISIRDSCLFYKLDNYNFRRLANGGSLYSFYILVSSCAKRKENMNKGPSQSVKPQTGASCIYKDAYYFKDLIDMPHPAQQPQYRHVEISSTEKYPHYLSELLEITESLSINDNEHLSVVTSQYHTTPRLKDILIERCRGMERVYDTHYDSNVAHELENMRIGHLPQIITLYKEVYRAKEVDLFALKHLHVYNCGKLESLFPDMLIFSNLETLIIRCCDRLRTVFYKSWCKPVVRENRLQSLRNIHFEELPQVQHIYEECQIGSLRVPQWKTLYFRGCWSLRQLPLLVGPRNQQVCVDGEFRQCKKLIAQMKAEQYSLYKFKSPPPVASLKDDVKNMIFLK